MWTITVRSPNGEPNEHTLKPGETTIGRMAGNDITILDSSASRYHAKLSLDEATDAVTLHDLQSTNGTFINRERLIGARRLEPDDVIRIGQHLINLNYTQEGVVTYLPSSLNTQLLTRELLLESLDQHAVLLTEVAARLNTVTELEAALREVADLVKVSMGADRCEVLLAEQFECMSEMELPTSIARQAMEKRSAVTIRDAMTNATLGQSASLLRVRAAMCVPILSGEQILGLLYVYKTQPEARPFDHRDVQLAVAIGHQAALTIQRMQLLKQVQQEEVMTRILRRFLSPQEAQYLLEEYIAYGKLPGLDEYHLTVLAADLTNSTGLSERLGARRFGKVLNRYYQSMSEIIFEYNGILNKFLGDGIMAVFGMTKQYQSPEESAILAGLKMIECIKSLRKELDEPLEIGVGINSGLATAGYMGTEDYIEFTVLGYPVNIAWGLESLARPNRLFIGYPTYQAIAGKFLVQEMGLLEIKNRIEPVYAYEIMPQTGKFA